MIWSDPFDAMTSGNCLRNVHWPGGLWSSVAVGITKVRFGPVMARVGQWMHSQTVSQKSVHCGGPTVPHMVGIQALGTLMWLDACTW